MNVDSTPTLFLLLLLLLLLLSPGMARVKKSIEAAGGNLSSTFIFYGGHSLGGAMMPAYVESHAADEAVGQILMGKWRSS